MKKLISLLLALTLALSLAAPALAEYPEYLNFEGDFPVVKDGFEAPELSIYVTRDVTYGVDSDKMWAWAYLKNGLNMNFDVTQILASARTEQKNLIMASGDMPDIMVDFSFTTSELVKYGAEGMLLDLSPYINEELTPNLWSFLERYPDIRAGITMPNGAIYTLPKLSLAKNDAHPTAYFVNTEWTKAVGYEELPTDLDSFIEMLRAIKAQDPGETGGKVVPLGGFYNATNPSYLIYNAMGYVGASADPMTPMVRDGNAAIVAADKDSYKKYVETMKLMYDEGLIASDFFTGDSTQFKADASEEIYCAYFSIPYFYVTEESQWKQYHAGSPLTSEFNDTLQWQSQTALRGVGGFVVSAETEYPELIMRFADWSFSNDHYKTTQGPLAISDADYLYGMTGGIWLSTDGSGIYGWVDVDNGIYDGEVAMVNSQYRWDNISFGRLPPYTNFEMDSNYMFVKEQNFYIDDFEVRDPSNPEHYQRLTQREAYWPYLASGFPGTVYFDEDTQRTISDLKLVLSEYSSTEFAKFVTGARSMDEFDDFYAQMEKLGIAEYAKYYADAYEAYKLNLAQ